MICNEMMEYCNKRMRKMHQALLADIGVSPGRHHCRTYDYKFNIGDMAFIPRFLARINFKRDNAVGAVINRYFIKPDLEPYYEVEIDGKKFRIGEELLCRNTFVQNVERK